MHCLPDESCTEPDQVSWALEKSGIYTRSMYRAMPFRGFQSARTKQVWKAHLPMKSKKILWLSFAQQDPVC
uniref:Uncharacterized protein n=1 Tax=Arundo donax TaxID=35708 RepID=A0A0A9BP25_ARUDO